MSSPKNNQDSIGKGLRSLLQNIDKDIQGPANKPNSINTQPITQSNRLKIEDISINPKQPRRDFDETSLQELSNSIKMHDIIQPITVSVLANGKYQLISGERRLKASILAGLKDIPAYIRKVNDATLLEMAIIENVQREDLNAIEIALSYKRMMDELNYTQDKIAEQIGKERTSISHYIRLLKLPPDIQASVRIGKITMGHAKALINIEFVENQLFVFNEIIAKNLNVRQTEDLARTLLKNNLKNNKSKEIKKAALDSNFKKIEDKLCHHLETKVILNHNKNGYGNIVIEYYSLQDLNNILERLKLNAQ